MNYVQAINNLLSIDFLGFKDIELLQQKIKRLASKVKVLSVNELINYLGVKDFKYKLLETKLEGDYEQKMMILSYYFNNLSKSLSIKKNDVNNLGYCNTIINKFIYHQHFIEKN